jgi:DNA-binding XRE family transcriptional regulator
MLPYNNRLLSIPRSKYAPSRINRIPVQSDSNSLGSQLRRQRAKLGIFQAEAARRLKISGRTLSLWECDRLYPTWPYWPRIVAYLGHDPFNNPARGCPQSNKSQFVAILSGKRPLSFIEQIMEYRVATRKNWLQLGKEFGVSAKTLRGWTTGRRQPSKELKSRIEGLLVRANQKG